MAFTNTKGRYASFGVAASLSGDVIDSIWYIIDNFLKGVFDLDKRLHFELLNRGGLVTFRFSQRHFKTRIEFDFNLDFDPFFPSKVYVLDHDGKETIVLPEEYELF